jgi:2-polyprenyl-3-methyl-5-hydroxy-6-metoxy-1,4-benzoquinol methylase
MDNEHYYRELALAYVRGKCPDLAVLDDVELLERGRARGLRLHRFKRTAGLPRVRRVIGALKGFAPASLLDIGSGRGTFLWPLIDELGELTVTAVDVLEHRVDDINAVGQGGVGRLSAVCRGAEDLSWHDDCFDAVTVLEVLEHVADPTVVAAQVVRLAKRVAIATVPAKEDDNPGHVRLFSGESLAELFNSVGAADVRIEHVLNHIVAVVQP